MVKYNEEQLNDVFLALADSTRRAILSRLADGDASVSELAEPFDISLPAVSKHLTVLERAALIERRKDGRMRRCGLQADTLREAAAWIDFYKRFWEGRLDSLERYLESSTDIDGG